MIEPSVNTTTQFIVVVVPFALALIIGWLRIDAKSGECFAWMGTGFTYMILVMIFWAGPINQEYQANVQELIDTSPCEELPVIYDEYPYDFKDNVIDEIVLRCWMDVDPRVIALVTEARG